jgi:predicted regulator of Ras-like GTPase activity (Roadblock/LC7/MglB family)
LQLDGLTPQDAPARLCELSPDVRAAVLIDAAGALVAASEDDPERAEELAGLVRELVELADEVADSPPEQLEAQVDGGAVFVSRGPHHILAAVTRKAALSSLMLFDQRALLAAVEEGA